MSGTIIRFSDHARFEMRRRGIRKPEVIRTILQPGQVLSSIKGRKIYQSLIGPSNVLLLRVVVKEVPGAYDVITVYKTSKIAKYWR